MATETLKLGVDSSEVKAAASDLDKLGGAAKQTEKATDAIGRSYAQMGVQIGKATSAAITAVSALVGAYINYADKLHDMSQRTGIAASELGALEFAASQSGLSLEKLEVALGLMSNKAADAAAGSKSAAAVFKAMGITVTDASGAMKGQSQLLTEVAEKFATYKDGTAKAALAQDLFGRSGRELIPLLNKGAEGIEEMKKQYRDLGGLTDDSAARLNEFNNRVGVLFTQTKIVTGQFVQGLLPALTQAVAAFENVSKKMGEAEGAGDGLGEVIGIVTEFGMRAAGAFYGVGTAIGAMVAAINMVAHGEFKAALQTMKDMLDELNRHKVQLEKDIATVAQLRNRQLRNQEDRGFVPGGTGDKDAPSTARASADRVKAYKEESEAVKLLNKDLETFGEVLGSLEDENKKYHDMLVRIKNAAVAFGLSQEQVDKLVAHYKATLDVTTIAMNAAEKATSELNVAQVKAVTDHVAELEKELKTQTEANELIGKTKEYIDAVVLARLDDNIALKEANIERMRATEGVEPAYIAALERELATLRKVRDARASGQAAENAATQAKEYENAWVGAFNSIDQTMEQVFTDMLHGGKDAITRLADTIKSGLLSLLYQLTVRPFIVNIMASISGVGAGQLAPASGITALLGGGPGGSGGLGSLFNLFGGGTGGGTGGFLSNGLMGLGNLFPVMSPFLEGSAAFVGPLAAGTSLMSGASTIAPFLSALAPISAALPFIGIAVALASMFGGKGGGPKTGGFAATAGLDLGPAFAGDNNRYFTPNQADTELADVVKNTARAYQDYIKQLGGKAGQEFGFAVGYDTDPEGSASNRAHIGAWVGGKQVYDYQSGDDSLGRDSEALQAAIEIETKRALLAALQASDLPDAVAAILDTVVASSATSEDIDNVVEFATAFQGLLSFLDNLDVTRDVTEALAEQNRSSVESLSAQADEVGRLTDAFDGTIEATQNLAQATGEYYSSLVQMLVGIENLKKQISAMFSDTREDLRTSVMSDDEKRKYYQDQALILREQLSRAQSPEEVARLTEGINNYVRMNWELMTPEQRKEALPEQLRLLDAVEAEANARLDIIAEGVRKESEALLADVRTLLGDFVTELRNGNNIATAAANAQAAAAAAQGIAADKQLAAAGATVRIEVTGGGVVNA